MRKPPTKAGPWLRRSQPLPLSAVLSTTMSSSACAGARASRASSCSSRLSRRASCPLTRSRPALPAAAAPPPASRRRAPGSPVSPQSANSSSGKPRGTHGSSARASRFTSDSNPFTARTTKCLEKIARSPRCTTREHSGSSSTPKVSSHPSLGAPSSRARRATVCLITSTRSGEQSLGRWTTTSRAQSRRGTAASIPRSRRRTGRRSRCRSARARCTTWRSTAPRRTSTTRSGRE
mmetsp:Transcript_24596/g.80406  ORF Transcript_24596/g.80406 Transcript_24596/m.80406 type:complete len:235 (+) Transcript_24596:924-1628(+)